MWTVLNRLALPDLRENPGTPKPKWPMLLGRTQKEVAKEYIS
jgi:hypothetical protein